jgi:hypothetical protein
MSRGPDWQIAADVKSENNIGFIKLSDTKTRGYPSSHIFPITEEIDHVFRQTHHIQLWKALWKAVEPVSCHPVQSSPL